MNYLDSSALMKLTHPERGTRALRSWLAVRPGVAVSSALVMLEVTRALRRSDPAALPRIPDVPSRITLVPIDQPIMVSAAALTDPLLRSPDALHLATALRLDAPSLVFVSYDKRLSTAAAQEGLTVAVPA
ncbi:PIN domain-containing protein [Frankia sp. B2]|uniref:type II toxin-antitoxin system VapC family toxin n=1 Tax=Frankia TaxID=1854 RepID=UPI0003D00220|nr:MULTISPECIES: type II toxin-antitoxin system VapC family toxin [Frankia]ETA01655.1 putative nucleic acid-binding protein [Frankia sp. CcI6]KFB03902.1 putative nucleic acid-binding protein, contains PIN domain [Frankia sp. Allo2]OAA29320.1 putative nucleic acid-binding protein, contains PIN domain [Frankia casuarinae]OHV48552.1 twitching motility protein PilT [Frankia sp. CgIS1]ORT93834.1 VapC toxin family PIN domain ribonuclease [Frankia casuarinae]